MTPTLNASATRTQSSPVPRRKPSVGWRRGVAGLGWAFLASVVCVWVLLATLGDRWWFATVMLYSPRWIYLLPLIALVPLALWRNRWSLLSLALGALLVLGPVMGFCLPFGRAAADPATTLRVLTCNVAGGEEAWKRLAVLVINEQPDVVALQECEAEVNFVWPKDWTAHRVSGLLIASRYPIHNVEQTVCLHPPNQWPRVDAIRCRIATPQGELTFCNVHLQTPREGLELVLDRFTIVNPARSWELDSVTADRRAESADVREWLNGAAAPVIVAGDFNLPADSAIFRASWSSLSDAFSKAGRGYGYTKISDKRGLQFGARIDHILFDDALGCGECRVGSDVGSDHLPLIADLILQ